MPAALLATSDMDSRLRGKDNLIFVVYKGTTLGSVDKSYFKALRPAACRRDPETLLNEQAL